MIRNKYIPFYIFIAFLAFFILSTKFLGYRGRANLYPSDPLSWEEIYNNLLGYVIWSVILTFVSLMFYKYASEQEKQNRENARKRMEEREQEEEEKRNIKKGKGKNKNN